MMSVFGQWAFAALCPVYGWQVTTLSTPPSILSRGGKRVVIHVFTWITEVETFKTADCGYVRARLYGYRPKSATAGLGYRLCCTPFTFAYVDREQYEVILQSPLNLVSAVELSQTDVEKRFSRGTPSDCNYLFLVTISKGTETAVEYIFACKERSAHHCVLAVKRVCPVVNKQQWIMLNKKNKSFSEILCYA